MDCATSSSSTLPLLSDNVWLVQVRLTRQMEDMSTCYPLAQSLSRVTQTFLGERHVWKCSGQTESAASSNSFVMSPVGVLDWRIWSIQSSCFEEPGKPVFMSWRYFCFVASADQVILPCKVSLLSAQLVRVISGGACGIWKTAVHTTSSGSSDQDLISTLQLATPGNLECNSVAINRFLYVQGTSGEPSLPAQAVFLYIVWLTGAGVQVISSGDKQYKGAYRGRWSYWYEGFCGVLWGLGDKADIILFIWTSLAPHHKICTSV